MVRHVVLFQLKKDLDEAKKAEVMKNFKEGIEALPQVIPFIRNIEVGFNVNADEAWDICLNSEFSTLEDTRLYGANPHHVKVAGALKPFLAGRACTDYEF